MEDLWEKVDSDRCQGAEDRGQRGRSTPDGKRQLSLPKSRQDGFFINEGSVGSILQKRADILKH